jgi:hypothetical protein
MFVRARGCVAVVGARPSGTYYALVIDSATDKKQFIENLAGTETGAKAALFEVLNPR